MQEETFNLSPLHMSRRSKYTIAISKYDLPNKKKSTLEKFFKIPRPLLDDAFDRGVGAYNTNPGCVRKGVVSEEQWATARIYAFIMKAYDAVNKGKKKINQDQDLFEKIINKLK